MTKRGSHLKNPVFECIASRYRREILLILRNWGPAVSRNRLAIHLTTEAQATSSPSATEIGTIQTTLTHVHLPVLADADLISWDRDSGIVRPTTHPALGDPRFEQLLHIQADDLDAILSALSHEYRRIALTVLEAERTKSRTELAEVIHHRIPETVRPDLPSVEDISISLHHAHLPKLNEIGLIEFAPSTGQVTYSGHPVLERVFTIIFEPDESAVDKLDGFLGGLADSYQEASRGTNSQMEWPDFWNDPYYG